MEYRSICTLYYSYISPVACYGAGVWSFKDYPAPWVLQNKTLCFYLGVHCFASVAMTHLKMNILSIAHARWLEQIRYFNRLVNMNDSRLPERVLLWEMQNGWLGGICKIAAELHLPEPTLDFYIT